jgi:hypothetical protein
VIGKAQQKPQIVLGLPILIGWSLTMRKALCLPLFLAASGCANVNYATVEKGEFNGEMAVVWLKGTEGPGDGTFIYVPTPNKPLTFTRPSGTEIAPTMIYTDGGSVPPVARAFRGFTPWNYGPAYIVHDWLFRAKQCWADGKRDEAYKVVADMSFEESAEIIAESIKALHESGRVRKDDVSGAAVTAAVTSPISYQYWTETGACKEVTDAHRRMALEAIGRSPEIGDRSRARMLASPDGGAPERTNAEVVAVVSFD